MQLVRRKRVFNNNQIVAKRMNFPIIYKQPTPIAYNYASQTSVHNQQPIVHFCTPTNQYRQLSQPTLPAQTYPQPMPTFTQIYNTISHNTSRQLSTKAPLQNSHISHLFPLANTTGYLPRTPAVSQKIRPNFQPIRRTEETASEMSSSVVEQPLVMEDFVDIEGQFRRGTACRQQVEYEILQEGQQKNQKYCRKWC